MRKIKNAVILCLWSTNDFVGLYRHLSHFPTKLLLVCLFWNAVFFGQVKIEPVQFRHFPIMLVKLAFYAPSNSRLTPKKNAHIMLDSQNNATLVPENASCRFKQNVQTGFSISTFSTFLSRFDASWTKYGFAIQNTFLGGKDFSTSTAKQASFSDNKILARELL